MHFNANVSTASIYRKNTAIHQSIIGSSISRLGSLLSSISPNFDFIPGSRLLSNLSTPDPQLASRLSIPDLQITYTDEAAKLLCEPIFVLEVGFSQSSKDLEESVRNILEELPLVKAAILVDIKESPRYQNPLRKTENAGIIRRAIQTDPTSLRENLYVEEPTGKYGPLWRFGIRWLGELNATAQVWTKDSKNKKVVARGRIVSTIEHHK